MAVPGAVLVVVMMRVLLAATMGQVVGTMAMMAAGGMVRMVVVMMGHSGIWRSAFSMETAGGTGQDRGDARRACLGYGTPNGMLSRIAM